MPETHRFFILTDTHVGDRAKRLDPGLLKAAKAYAPERILHCGDACRPQAIALLEEIAPVTNCQGNRDWLQNYHLPISCTLEVNGLKIVLAHGHLNMAQYLLDKARLIFTQSIPRYHFFRDRLAKKYPEADLILYGHTHIAADDKIGDQRLINVGAGYPNWVNKRKVEYGTLEISPEAKIYYQHFAINPTEA